jgi:hypothetical protein
MKTVFLSLSYANYFFFASEFEISHISQSLQQIIMNQQPMDNSHDQRYSSGSAVRTSQASEFSELYLEAATDTALLEVSFDEIEFPDQGSRKRKPDATVSFYNGLPSECNKSNFEVSGDQVHVNSKMRSQGLGEKVISSQPVPYLEEVDLPDKNEYVDGVDAVGSTSCSAAESLQIVQQCQRFVQGSLGDVSGLE